MGTLNPRLISQDMATVLNTAVEIIKANHQRVSYPEVVLLAPIRSEEGQRPCGLLPRGVAARPDQHALAEGQSPCDSDWPGWGWQAHAGVQSWLANGRGQSGQRTCRADQAGHGGRNGSAR